MDERFPVDFKPPRGLKNYEPNMDPTIWIENYAMVMSIQNASYKTATRYLPMMLEGTTRTWINNLPRDSINSWEDMKTAFVKNFEETYRRPCTMSDIKRCVQRDNESTRH